MSTGSSIIWLASMKSCVAAMAARSASVTSRPKSYIANISRTASSGRPVSAAAMASTSSGFSSMYARTSRCACTNVRTTSGCASANARLVATTMVAPTRPVPSVTLLKPSASIDHAAGPARSATSTLPPARAAWASGIFMSTRLTSSAVRPPLAR